MPLSVFLVATLVSFVTSAIFFALNGLILKFIAGWLKFDDDTFGTSFTVAGYAAIVSFVLSLIPTFFASFFLTVGQIVALIINLVFIVVNAAVFVGLIRKFYEQTVGKALLAWFILFVINIILGMIVGLVIGALTTAFAFNAGKFV
jgi:hypothetical protein